MKDFIPFALHDIDDADIAEVVDTLKSNWITTGPKAKIFEDDFAKYIGAGCAVALNSATAGLHLALECFDLKPGDKVITTPYTFTATAEVIRYFNADPLFIDIKENDYNIDPKKIERFCRDECLLKDGVLFHKKTDSPVKAIIPVHIGGCPCDMDEILDIARRYNLKIVEDAAHALPSTYKGKRVGTLSDITVFSFYATKTITTAEGGMAVTNNPQYDKRMRIMGYHGIDRNAWDRYSGEVPRWYYEVVEAGFKYNMTDIAAGLGVQQLKKADAFYEKRRRIASIYNKELSGIREIELPKFEIKEKASSWHLYIIKVNSRRISRDDFIKGLFKKGVGASVHFIPLHIHPYYRDKYRLSPEDFPVAYDCYKRVVSLPIYTKLREEDVLRIVDSIKELIC